MKLTSLCLVLLLFCALRALPQDIGQIFQARETFEGSTVMTKVIVCAEDQSVWAISDAGEVYYKRNSEPGFTKFGQTSCLQVADLAGYNANEMYFLVGGKLYGSKNMGLVSEIFLPIASQINNIAVVNATRNVYLEGYQGKRDWLAIATNSIVHILFRDNGTFRLFTPISTGYTTPECRITNGGFKSLDFQYKYPSGSQCFGPVEYTYFNKIGLASPTETVLPEDDPIYSGRVNCTYFEAPFNLEKDGNAGFDYWGTDKGLFIKTSGGCGLSNVRKVQGINVKINDLEELNFFRDIFNDKVLLAGADDGLYYSTRPFAPEVTSEIDKIGFNKLFDFDRGVNSIALELAGFEEEGKQLCQTAVWLATAKGIVKIPMAPATKNVFKDKVGRNGLLVSVDAGLKDAYCVSNGEQYKFRVNLPSNNPANYLVQWYRDPENYGNRTEIDSLRGLTERTLSDRGMYSIKITSLSCGEYVDVGPYYLRDPDRISTDFNYPPVVSMFEGCSYIFRARAGIQYKWKKGDDFLPETSEVLEAFEPGIYQLYYMDPCSETFMPLPPVELKERQIADPVITRSNNLSLCYGDKVTLSVDDPGIDGVTYEWLWNGHKIIGKTSREIEAYQPGNYEASVILGVNCFKRSATAIVEINEELKLTPPPEIQICTLRGQRLNLTGPEGFAKYTWEGMTGTANFLEVTAPGEYSLEVEDASGCTASTTYIVVPYCSPPVPPNAFSPNGDGINDLWTVGGLEDDPNAIIHIYNRFGVSVFDGSAKQPSWNGKLKGADVPDGTYYYVVTKKSAKPLTGSLVLIR